MALLTQRAVVRQINRVVTLGAADVHWDTSLLGQLGHPDVAGPFAEVEHDLVASDGDPERAEFNVEQRQAGAVRMIDR